MPRILPPATLVHTWRPVQGDEGQSPYTVHCVRDLGDGRVAVGGDFARFLKWDGSITFEQPYFGVFAKDTRQPDAFAPQFDGPVRCLLVVGTTLYVGGYFTHVGTTPRGGGAAFDLADGSLLPWDPRVDDARVATLEASADGAVIYIGGDFHSSGVLTGIQGHPLWHTGAVDAVTGDIWYGTAVDGDGNPLPWTAPCNNPCRRLVRDGSWLYVCLGLEDVVNPGVGVVGEPGADAGKGSTCRVSVDDGAVDPAFDLFAIGFKTVSAQDVLVTADTVWVCGYFCATSDNPRNHIAAFDKDGTLLGWDAGIAPAFGYAGHCLALAPDGLTVYMGADVEAYVDAGSTAGKLRLFAGYDTADATRVFDVFGVETLGQICYAAHLEADRLWVGGEAMIPPDGGPARALLAYDTAGDISGDPYITTVRGETFEFAGKHGRVYDFYSAPSGLRVLPRIAGLPPDGAHTCVSGVDVLLPGGGKVVVLAGGLVHVLAADGHHVKVDVKACTLDAPNHLGCTTWQPHPLMGVPHLNVSVPGRPGEVEGATGLMVDGDREDRVDADYEVRGPF